MPRYQNTAVYLSAERLLASKPKKKSLWQRVPRPALFLGGLACGLLAAMALSPAWRAKVLPFVETEPDVSEIDNAPTSQASQQGSATRSGPSNFRSTTPPRTTTAATPSSTPATTVPAGTTTHAPAISTLPSPDSAASRAQPEVAASPLIAVGLSVVGLNLHGELQNEGGAPLRATLQLFVRLGAQQSHQVHGTVAIFGEDPNGTSIPVTGSLVNNRLTLNEALDPNIPLATPHHAWSFDVVLPEKAESEVVTGQWAQGVARRGTLTLRAVPGLLGR